MSINTFNLFSREPRQNPYPYYTELRDHAPVHRFEQNGFWAVSRYADVAFVLKRPDLFSSSIMAPFDAALLGADPPCHTRVRKIVAKIFTPQRLASIESHIRVITDRLIDRAVAHGRCELIADLAAPLPLSVITDMLGAGPDRSDDFHRWSHAVLVSATGSPGPEETRQIRESLKEFTIFLEEHIERCRRQPGQGILSDLLLGGAEEERLTVGEAAGFARLLLLAGNETTTNLIGNAVLALLGHAHEMDIVRANPRFVPAVVEEALRYDTPVQFVQRIARQTVEFRDVQVPAGDRIIAMLGSANRDQQRFPDPDRFSVTRKPRNHLAFGAGPHFCLGASLARLEARIILEALFSRRLVLREAQSLDKVEHIDSTQLRGPRRLELVVELG
ncbi:MAG: cytochrome P450 [Chloroflexota bacterium]